MPDIHDQGVINATSVILDQTRSGVETFKQIFSSRFSRTGFTGWPQPDMIFNDYLENKEITIALEYKPPNQEKREYMTGLGQTISYLYNNDYAGLVLPKFSKDGFAISDFVTSLVKERDELKKLPICIYDYEPTKEISKNNLFVRKSITLKNGKNLQKKLIGGVVPVFWSWWRDISNYELYDILSLCDKYNSKKTSDIYTEYVWPEFKKKLESGDTMNWEGQNRKRNSIPAGEKQNYKIPLFQLDLINQNTGHLTQLGFRFLSLAKQNGANSEIFLNSLGSHILNEGKHMQLINLQFMFQEQLLKEKKKFNSGNFKIFFDEYLVKIGQVPPLEKRKPGRKTTGNKQSYIRDEFKLWNKLGFVLTKNGKYFRSNYGIQFNWPKIVDIYNFDVSRFL